MISPFLYTACVGLVIWLHLPGYIYHAIKVQEKLVCPGLLNFTEAEYILSAIYTLTENCYAFKLKGNILEITTVARAVIV